ncbi:Disease resistance protein TAO1 [Ananas comosus]|uniref:Disease resistance protein TAO1 n=1 Tax=Ananas comosus TaxID=4615 RepID=A0A199VGQ5_ANACO|nr:Disease resistance protein TAO1 [Ananas comosus]
MAEGLVFELVKEVLDKLGSALWNEIGLLRSFKDDVKDLERKLLKIQAVLLDAEERSNAEKENHTLRIWLSELKGAAYDIDDLLDEIRTQAVLWKQQRQVRNQNQLARKVCDQFLSCANPIHLKSKFKMAHRMKALREKIDNIAKQRDAFGLVEAGPRRQAEFKRPETFSLVDEKTIVGRDGDKEEIRGKMLTPARFTWFQNSYAAKLNRYLNLSSTNIQELPEPITSLCNLQTLNLSWCREIRILPKSLGRLTNLRILDLSECRSLTILDSISNLQNLHALNLSSCKKAISLEPICHLKNLHYLDLSHLDSFAALPESIGSLQNLRILDLSNCSSLESLPSSLCDLKNLHDLNLYCLNSLVTLPESIGSLQNLRILNLSGCYSLLPLPSSSSDLLHLEKLDISGCEKLCELPKMIQKLTKLRVLLNNNCSELKGMPRGIGKLVSLQKLPVFVVGKQDRVEHCASISELEHLKLVDELWIKGLENVTSPVDAKAANLIEKNLRSLKLFPALTSLDLCSMPMLREWVTVMTVDDEEGRRERVPLFPCLAKLILYECPQFSPEPCLPASVEYLEISGTSSENLSLILERATPLDGGDAAVSLQPPPNKVLQYLIIDECQQLTCLPESLRGLTSLQRLDIWGCHDLERIEDWLGELSDLQSLTISKCRSLRYLPARKMAALQMLYIGNCPLLFDADGRFVDTSVDHIKEVYVNGSSYRYKKQASSSPQEEESSAKEEKKIGWCCLVCRTRTVFVMNALNSAMCTYASKARVVTTVAPLVDVLGDATAQHLNWSQAIRTYLPFDGESSLGIHFTV